METKPVRRARWSLYFRKSFGSQMEKETKESTETGPSKVWYWGFHSVRLIIKKLVRVERKY
jgi:hypothetical protein